LTSQDDEYRELEGQFTAGMYEAYRFLARTINYRAIWFLDMLAQQGGVPTARRLLYGKDATYGLERLREAGMLDRSLEAWVIDPRFERPHISKSSLFDYLGIILSCPTMLPLDLPTA
jgi:hypothetical protein